MLSKEVNEYFCDIVEDKIGPHAVTALNDAMCLSSDQWYMLLEKLPVGFSNVRRGVSWRVACNR